MSSNIDHFFSEKMVGKRGHLRIFGIYRALPATVHLESNVPLRPHFRANFLLNRPHFVGKVAHAICLGTFEPSGNNEGRRESPHHEGPFWHFGHFGHPILAIFATFKPPCDYVG